MVETIPDRREPFTIETLNVFFGQPEHSSLFACCRDWFGSGMYTGYHCTPFCQDSSKTRAILDIFGDTKAFCLDDFTWQLTSGMRLTGAECLAHPRSTIYKSWMRWRTQKNGIKCGTRMFIQPDAADHSWIKFLYSIVKRFVALRGPLNATSPLSVYLDPT